MMHGRGKSSPVIVARKPANKADPETVSAAESMERRAGAEGKTTQNARTGLRAGYAWSWLASIHQAAMLDCQNPRREPYAGKLQVRVWAGGARQLASLPRQGCLAAIAHSRLWHTAAINQGALCPQLARADIMAEKVDSGFYSRATKEADSCTR